MPKRVTVDPRSVSDMRVSSERRGDVPVRMYFDKRGKGSPTVPNDLPTLDIPEVTHLGTLNVDDKKSHSYEGPLLSVSNTPDRWRKIAKLGGLPEHKIEGGTFADRHAMSSSQWKDVIAWAQSSGHVTPTWEYSVDHGYDEELGDTYTSSHSSVQQAREEAKDVGATRVTGRKTVKPTGTDARGMSGGDYALTQAAKQKGLRGVWWDDVDDDHWSAPRGGVFYERK